MTTSRSLPPTQLAIVATAAPNNCGERLPFASSLFPTSPLYVEVRRPYSG